MSDDSEGAGGRPPLKDMAYGSLAGESKTRGCLSLVSLRVLKVLLYALVGAASKVFEHPFDLIKVRLQSQPVDRPPRFKGPLDCFTQTWKHEGLRGLYRVSFSPFFL
jgi:hypothetical protein